MEVGDGSKEVDGASFNGIRDRFACLAGRVLSQRNA